MPQPDLANPPAVSVLMTVYNGQRYLPQAVRSILAQTFADYEFLIVDDGSTDRTPVILQQFSRVDARIRLFRHDNVGLTKSLNRALLHVRGRYLARMDADDVSLPERFARQVSFLEAHNEHVLIGGRCLLIDPDGYPICQKREIVYEHEQIDRSLMAMGWPLVHPAVMMRTEAVRKVGGYD